MDEYQILYSQAALRDLKAIFSYVAYTLKAYRTAEKLTGRIRSQIRTLSQMPNRYEKVSWEPWTSAGMRRLPIGNYIVFYLVDESCKTVTVVRIFYGGRNIENMIRSESE